MIDLCDSREYRAASERYIELTVGNAAWPVGVTSVGIHERVGRSKISSSNISHTLNDDTTRKYMQVFKRLMKQCQNVNPPDDVSNVLWQTAHSSKIFGTHCVQKKALRTNFSMKYAICNRSSLTCFVHTKATHHWIGNVGICSFSAVSSYFGGDVGIDVLR